MQRGMSTSIASAPQNHSEAFPSGAASSPVTAPPVQKQAASRAIKSGVMLRVVIELPRRLKRPYFAKSVLLNSGLSPAQIVSLNGTTGEPLLRADFQNVGIAGNSPPLIAS